MRGTPTNAFAYLDGPPSYGHEAFLVVCAVTFIVAAALVARRLAGSTSFARWSLAGLCGAASVGTACGIAEMFTYQQDWGDEPTLPIVLFAAFCAAIMAGAGALASAFYRSDVHG